MKQCTSGAHSARAQARRAHCTLAASSHSCECRQRAKALKRHSNVKGCSTLRRDVRSRVTLESLASSPYRDALAAFVTAFGSIVLVKSTSALHAQGLIDKKDARKLTHILAGPGFVIAWPLFSSAPYAPLIAACIPGLNALRLAAAGSGAIDAPGLVASVSRSKDRTELLRGPLIYCFVLIAATIVSWRDHMPGLCAIAMMCGGDGVADLIGRRVGKAKLPWNPVKSWAGSVAMLLGGFALMCGLIWYFSWLGYMRISWPDVIPTLLGIAAACTAVESLPATYLDDNWSVPFVAAALTSIAGFSLRAVELNSLPLRLGALGG